MVEGVTLMVIKRKFVGDLLKMLDRRAVGRRLQSGPYRAGDEKQVQSQGVGQYRQPHALAGPSIRNGRAGRCHAHVCVLSVRSAITEPDGSSMSCSDRSP